MKCVHGPKPATVVSAEQAAGLVRSDDWIDYGFGLAQPDEFDRALAQRAGELRHVRIRSALTMRPRAVLEADREGEHFLWFNWHFSAYDRKQHDAGRCNYIPMNFGEAPGYYRRFVDPISVACIKTAPMDADGRFNLGCSTTYLRAMLERSRIVIAETVQSIPRVPGSDNWLDAEEVD
jgi:acyl-CoA hydrolase